MYSCHNTSYSVAFIVNSLCIVYVGGLYSNYSCDKMALSKHRSQTLFGSQTQIEPQSRSRAFSDRGKSYSQSL